MKRGIRHNSAQTSFAYYSNQSNFGIGSMIGTALGAGRNMLQQGAGTITSGIRSGANAATSGVGKVGAGLIKRGNQMMSAADPNSFRGAVGNTVSKVGQGIGMGANATNQMIGNNAGKIALGAGALGATGAAGLGGAAYANRQKQQSQQMM